MLPRIAVASLLVALAGCSPTERALRPVAERSDALTEATFDLPDAYEIVDVTYSSSLVALDEDPDEDEIRERATVQVFARQRESGEEALFVYDLALSRSTPISIVRFRRIPEAGLDASSDTGRRRW